jgi:hypothetical protein
VYIPVSTVYLLEENGTRDLLTSSLHIQCCIDQKNGKNGRGQPACLELRARTLDQRMTLMENRRRRSARLKCSGQRRAADTATTAGTKKINTPKPSGAPQRTAQPQRARFRLSSALRSLILWSPFAVDCSRSSEKKKLGYVAVFSGNSEPLGGLVSSGKKTFGVGATRHPDWSCFWIHND